MLIAIFQPKKRRKNDNPFMDFHNFQERNMKYKHLFCLKLTAACINIFSFSMQIDQILIFWFVMLPKKNDFPSHYSGLHYYPQLNSYRIPQYSYISSFLLEMSNNTSTLLKFKFLTYILSAQFFHRETVHIIF